MTRPATLSDCLERIAGGVLQDVAIPEFLDAFYGAMPFARAAMLTQEPRLSGDARLDALAAAIAEYLSKRYALPVIPSWVGAPGRILVEPWFTTTLVDDRMCEYLAFSSPAEFRHRNIFTEALPLRRASQARMVR